MVDDPTRYLNLAGSEVTIPRLGVGTWAWGDRTTWGMGGYDTDFDLGSITAAWEASIDAGVTFFDTAEVYGDGESERIIGRLMADCDPATRERVTIATKFMPMPWKVRVTSKLMSSLRASLDRLGLPAVDLYQIHGPVSLRGHAALAEALATAHAAGLVRAVGVSNYSARETRAIDARAAPPRPAPGHQPGRVLAAAPQARDRRPAGDLCRVGRGGAGLLTAGSGAPHRQVHRFLTTPGAS